MIRTVLEAVFCWILRTFYRRLEVTGREHVPATGPVMFVVNHPNALVDAVVLMCHAGRPISFLAKEPLFRMPVLGLFVRALDSIPVYRHQDRADVTKNRATFAVARRVLAGGGSIAVFPEGTSHSEPQLKPFRTGAARIALGAAEAEGLDIVPVGLFYTAKTKFRSSALMCFGAPLRVVPTEADADGEPPAGAVRALTARLETALGQLTLQADRHDALELVAAAERILTSSTADPSTDLADRVQIRQRLLAGYGQLRETAPERLRQVQARVIRYETALREADLTPRFLPRHGYRAAVVLRVTAKAMAVLLLLLPVALAGMVIHAPGFYLTRLIGRRFQRRWPDVVATVKGLGGLLFYPITWAAVGWLVGARWGTVPGVIAGVAAPVTGYAALEFVERLDWLLGGARGLLLALTGKRRFLRLVAERNAIRDELLALGARYGL